MTHDYHPGLPGYDERQILHDGCKECEERGRHPALAISHMDPERFQKAWRRAFDLWASKGDSDAVGPVSHAEQEVLHILWVMEVRFESLGWPLTGRPPVSPLAEVLKGGDDG